jgi:sigma-E factor negative regulatory protein RseC
MIEENAIVVAIEGDDVLVQTQRRSACQACSVKSGCGTSVLSKVIGQKVSQIKVNNTLNANIGDEVTLGINDNALVHGSLLVYVLPLFFLLVFAMVGEYWAQSQNLNSELTSIVSGLLGFLIAAFVTRYSISKTRFKNQIQPHMLRVVHVVSEGRVTILAP